MRRRASLSHAHMMGAEPPGVSSLGPKLTAQDRAEDSTVEPLLMDPPRSGQPPSSGQTQKQRLICVMNSHKNLYGSFNIRR